MLPPRLIDMAGSFAKQGGLFNDQRNQHSRNSGGHCKVQLQWLLILGYCELHGIAIPHP